MGFAYACFAALLNDAFMGAESPSSSSSSTPPMAPYLHRHTAFTPLNSDDDDDYSELTTALFL